MSADTNIKRGTDLVNEIGKTFMLQTAIEYALGANVPIPNYTYETLVAIVQSFENRLHDDDEPWRVFAHMMSKRYTALVGNEGCDPATGCDAAECVLTSHIDKAVEYVKALGSRVIPSHRIILRRMARLAAIQPQPQSQPPRAQRPRLDPETFISAKASVLGDDDVAAPQVDWASVLDESDAGAASDIDDDTVEQWM